MGQKRQDKMTGSVHVQLLHQLQQYSHHHSSPPTAGQYPQSAFDSVNEPQHAAAAVDVVVAVGQLPAVVQLPHCLSSGEDLAAGAHLSCSEGPLDPILPEILLVLHYCLNRPLSVVKVPRA